MTASPPRRKARVLSGYPFLAPALVVFTLFCWYPVVSGFVAAFQDIDLVNPPTWVGTRNFSDVFSDPLFATAWRNTLQYTLYTILFGYLVPLALSLAIAEVRWGASFFRFAFYVPVMLPPIVSVFLWRWLYDPDSGLLNALLGLVGAGHQPWLQSTDTAMISIVLVATWGAAGGTTLIYLAALRGVPAQLYEAAQLDGAGIPRRLWHVTLPQLRGVLLLMFVLQVISSMQVFTEPFTLTGGGPANATTSVLILVYQYAFRDASFGKASALALVLFVVLGAFSLLYVRIARRVDT